MSYLSVDRGTPVRSFTSCGMEVPGSFGVTLGYFNRVDGQAGLRLVRMPRVSDRCESLVHASRQVAIRISNESRLTL